MAEIPSFDIATLGRCSVPSPIHLSTEKRGDSFSFVSDDERVLYRVGLTSFREHCDAGTVPPCFEVAGPREKIYFDPTKTRVAIVTCGGLCPGLNDVIRAMVMELHYHYGVPTIYGIRYGYGGLLPVNGHEPLMLTPKLVRNIHIQGGTILGSSRGGGDTEDLVDALERLNIGVLFTIGGDGTQRGAQAIHEEAARRGYRLAVIGVPKTIDNDFVFVERSFGFETAFSMAVEAIAAAHAEAEGAYNGIGLVKLMGRHSGFIAANAALARNDVNFVLVPEVPVDLEGDNGFLRHLRDRLAHRHHAVICVAEGVGQDWIDEARGTDASGNAKLDDVGPYLKRVISEDLRAHGMPYTLKYIDPSYMIRSAPAVPNDSIFCARLGQNAVHAAMAGKTGALIGLWNGVFTHVPLTAVTSERNEIEPGGSLWWSVVEATGQPMTMVNPS